jgi:hypothetical protein
MKLIAALLTCLYTSFAAATTVTSDFTDMWWVPTESGWGANVVQQGDTLFITLFVYGQDGLPTWYVSPATTYQGNFGAQQFSGTLYRTTGPYFGGTFNPGSVVVTAVGTLTFSAPTSVTANLSYSVGGVNVTKALQRQTWRTENFAGSYIGASVGNFTGCATGNGPTEQSATYSVQQTVNNVIINEFGNSGFTCRYTGTLVQNGKFGTITGTGQCSDGTNQNFTATEAQASVDFFSMKLVTTVSQCTFTGRLAGVRRN